MPEQLRERCPGQGSSSLSVRITKAATSGAEQETDVPWESTGINTVRMSLTTAGWADDNRDFGPGSGESLQGNHLWASISDRV